MRQLEVTVAPLNLEIETNGRGGFFGLSTNERERGYNPANEEEEGFHEGKVKPSQNVQDLRPSESSLPSFLRHEFMTERKQNPSSTRIRLMESRIILVARCSLPAWAVVAAH